MSKWLDLKSEFGLWINLLANKNCARFDKWIWSWATHAKLINCCFADCAIWRRISLLKDLPCQSPPAIYHKQVFDFYCKDDRNQAHNKRKLTVLKFVCQVTLFHHSQQVQLPQTYHRLRLSKNWSGTLAILRQVPHHRSYSVKFLRGMNHWKHQLKNFCW